MHVSLTIVTRTDGKFENPSCAQFDSSRISQVCKNRSWMLVYKLPMTGRFAHRKNRNDFVGKRKLYLVPPVVKRRIKKQTIIRIDLFSSRDNTFLNNVLYL